MTYSQADITKFASQEDFAVVVVNSFSQGKVNVVHWCCCREQHKKSGELLWFKLLLMRSLNFSM